MENMESIVEEKPKLLDQACDLIRLQHNSIRTEWAYADRVRCMARYCTGDLDSDVSPFCLSHV